MLTKQNYQDLTDGWDKDTILDCCKSQDPGDSSCVDCCYDSWQGELNTVTQKYNSILEKATQIQNKLVFITDRKNKYKAWLEEINNAQDLAVSICNQLELIALQCDKIWYNSCQAVHAVENLFCMIRDFFMQLDLIKTQYDNVQNCITNNTDPSLVKGQGILKFLDDYKAKLDIVLKLRDEIIKNIVTAVKICKLLSNEISTRDCNDNFDPCAKDQKPCAGEDIYYGFKTIICEWYNAFKCDVPCSDDGKGSTDSNTTAQSTPINMNAIQDDCGDDNCELLPTFDFPICNNTYKACVQKWLAADETEYTSLILQLQEANKQKEGLAACKNSLVKAIQAVDPKTRCN